MRRLHGAPSARVSAAPGCRQRGARRPGLMVPRHPPGPAHAGPCADLGPSVLPRLTPPNGARHGVAERARPWAGPPPAYSSPPPAPCHRHVNAAGRRHPHHGRHGVGGCCVVLPPRPPCLPVILPTGSRHFFDSLRLPAPPPLGPSSVPRPAAWPRTQAGPRPTRVVRVLHPLCCVSGTAVGGDTHTRGTHHR